MSGDSDRAVAGRKNAGEGVCDCEVVDADVWASTAHLQRIYS
jgi:hypothetical protein